MLQNILHSQIINISYCRQAIFFAILNYFRSKFFNVMYSILMLHNIDHNIIDYLIILLLILYMDD